MTDQGDPSIARSDPSLTDAADVARALAVDPETGLTAAEAARRLAEHGPNELRSTKKNPLWRRILAQFTDPLIILLLVAVAISVVAWIVEGAHGWPIDAVVIGAIIILNAVLGLVQEARAEQAVAALSVMTQAQSTVLRDGELRTVASAELVPGDLLVLGEGDQVGADGRLLRASALRIAEASLTGESEAVEKSATTLPEPVPLGDRLDMVYKGTAVARGTGRAIVTETGMATQMGAIATMLDETREEATPLQQEVGRIGRLLGRIVIVIAIVVMLTITLIEGIRTPADFVTILLLGVSLAVAAVPEGLPAIMSVVLALGVQRMAKQHAVVKQLSSVETLGSASVICTDKTGTLTTNQMTIERIVTASGTVDLSGAGYAPIGRAAVNGEPLEPGALRTEAQIVLGAGSLANDAQLAEHEGVWEIEGDPTEAAFLVAAHKLDGTVEATEQYGRIGDVPFSSERKMMSTVHRRADGTAVVLSKGAPDVLLERCTGVRVGDAVVPLTPERKAAALADIEALSQAAYRTLGVAYREAPEFGATGPTGGSGASDATGGSGVSDATGGSGVSDAAGESDATGARAGGASGPIVEPDESHERDLVYAGAVGIIDPPRPEVPPAITEAHRAGVRVIMITGDHPATAARIAADLGIVEPGQAAALTGTQLDALDDEAFAQAVRDVSVFARVAPEHKLRIVDALQDDGLVVAMTGDGVNDAPALKSADIGIAMGITGTEVTKEAANMVLADDDFATIVEAVREGRVIFDNIRKFLRYLLYSNMGEVLTVFFGVVFAGVLGLSDASNESIVLPLLATQILWINLVTDSAPALAMGVDPEIDDVMARPPRGMHERAIDGRMWVGIVTTGVTMAVVTLVTLDLFLPGGLIPGETGTVDVARTAGFTVLVFMALLTAFVARSATRSAFHGLFSNRWLVGAFVLGVVLQVLVVTWAPLQVAFGTAALDGAHWLWCAVAATSVLWVDEIRKAFVRATDRRRAASGIPAVRDAGRRVAGDGGSRHPSSLP
ncbi:cation-translocating P-type ATPase [Agromyces larvae]|uniref:Cation-translocating P-type ATPase n=1 Tax=Agromyces larvae TaxID=2929802 RepID=A0ABY4BUU5_9MICO|nr:cation-translocating P-type ATPase [Agromyces larvae]UOE42983.1 cation-translocating P-type ATPase [Agromyces larvae]